MWDWSESRMLLEANNVPRIHPDLRRQAPCEPGSLAREALLIAVVRPVRWLTLALRPRRRVEPDKTLRTAVCYWRAFAGAVESRTIKRVSSSTLAWMSREC